MRYKVTDIKRLKSIVDSFCEQKQLSRRKFALQLGISYRTLKRYLSGELNLPENLVNRIPEINEVVDERLEGRRRLNCSCGKIAVKRGRCLGCFREMKRRYSKVRRIKIKEMLISLLDGKCKNCGDDRYYVLQFHHKNKDKEFTVAKEIDKNIEELIKEVKKCKLLCANCHQEEHWRMNGNNVDMNEFRLRIANVV